jgi:NADPH:quinone reductase-like Zn-dependent oxidoreductase
MSQKVLLLSSKQSPLTVVTKPIPKPNSNEILVKIHAAALNPVDWKIQKLGYIIENFPTVIGVDAAGTVEEIGSDVKKFSKGDRVMFQGNPAAHWGAFQQYASVPEDFVAHIPKDIDFVKASTLPLCVFTPALGLYDAKTGGGLTPPWEAEGKGKYKGQAAIVFGGASSVGQFAIQLLKASGFSEIIATASTSNEALVKSLGATHFVDRNANFEAAVKALSNLPITVVADGVSTAETHLAGFNALAPGGILNAYTNLQISEEKLKEKNIKAFRVFAVYTPANEPYRRYFNANFTRFVEENGIVPSNVEIIPGGLGGVVKGLSMLENNQVSGKKLVVLPQDTL